MLKSLIWGAGDPPSEEEEDTTTVSQSLKEELQEGGPRMHGSGASVRAVIDAPRRFRVKYSLGRAGLAGPLSVNDPQLEARHPSFNSTLSDSFLTLPGPFGPPGSKNGWRTQSRDAPEHVHSLLRALMIARDYAGAARALATLHRMHSAFDPDVYRFTVALLRLSGDHQRLAMYFRKLVAVKVRSLNKTSALQGRAVAHDFLGFLADSRNFEEALSVSRDLLQGGAHSNSGSFKKDPLLQAHSAILHVFAALLEHRNASRAQVGEEAHILPRIPDLQDPLALIGRLRACRDECEGESGGRTEQPWHVRSCGHLEHARKLLKHAASGLPGSASVAGYRAAITAAQDGMVTAVQQLACFVERNPENVKGQALHARLLDMSLREVLARQQARQEQTKEHAELGGVGVSLVQVQRARVLRGWLQADPLETRPLLGLVMLHLQRAGDLVGVVDVPFLVQRLVEQLENHAHPRVCPRADGSGRCLYTSRAALALWDALSAILGPLRVRDEPVLLPRSGSQHVAPPRPGTLWDSLYGINPPWASGDFQQTRGGAGDEIWRGTPAPNPALRFVDKELWGETLLDPTAEPLLDAAGIAVGSSSRWCSDDEDCFLDGETEVLEQGAAQASRKSGGRVYFVPGADGPDALGFENVHVAMTSTDEVGGEIGQGASALGREFRNVAVGGASAATSTVADATVAGTNIRKGDAPGTAHEAGAGTGRDERNVEEDMPDTRNTCQSPERGRSKRGRDITSREDWTKRYRLDGRGLCEQLPISSEKALKDAGNGYAGSTAWRKHAHCEGSGTEGPSLELAETLQASQQKDRQHSEGVAMDTSMDADGADVPSVLREEEAPMAPSWGADAEATRLAETVAVPARSEAGMWLLANKCCVAAHLFGPQHPYCLSAIGRLCEDDVRGIARPAREALRRRGFRLQLTLARLSAEEVRADAAREGKIVVSMGLPSAPPGYPRPFDAYLPERFPPPEHPSAERPPGTKRLRTARSESNQIGDWDATRAPLRQRATPPLPHPGGDRHEGAIAADESEKRLPNVHATKDGSGESRSGSPPAAQIGERDEGSGSVMAARRNEVERRRRSRSKNSNLMGSFRSGDRDSTRAEALLKKMRAHQQATGSRKRRRESAGSPAQAENGDRVPAAVLEAVPSAGASVARSTIDGHGDGAHQAGGDGSAVAGESGPADPDVTREEEQGGRYHDSSSGR